MNLNKNTTVKTQALYHMVFVMFFIIVFLKIISSNARSVLPGKPILLTITEVLLCHRFTWDINSIKSY